MSDGQKMSQNSFSKLFLFQCKWQSILQEQLFNRNSLKIVAKVAFTKYYVYNLHNGLTNPKITNIKTKNKAYSALRNRKGIFP